MGDKPTSSEIEQILKTRADPCTGWIRDYFNSDEIHHDCALTINDWVIHVYAAGDTIVATFGRTVYAEKRPIMVNILQTLIDDYDAQTNRREWAQNHLDEPYEYNHRLGDAIESPRQRNPHLLDDN